MSSSSPRTNAERAAAIGRTIGVARGDAPGPTLIVVGGIHGNEPAGVLACKRVLERLAAERIPFRGEVACFAGNVGALRLGRRFIDKDMNRLWTERSLATVDERVREPRPDAEDREQRELRDAIEDVIARARGPVFAMDLHTTSAAGFPFSLYGDTLKQRRFAKPLPIPAILGLEEQVDGVLVEWLGRRGVTTMCIEAGQHDDPESIANLESALPIALVSAGLVDRAAMPGFDDAVAHLTRVRGDLPRVMEVQSRHAVEPEHAFAMEPGFANIARVRAGQLLARDRSGEIRAKTDGMLFLPLYQKQGSDGFFLGREIGAWGLRASKWARNAGLDRVLPLLPGIRRAGTGDALAVSARAARSYPAELFTLFGYRKRRDRADHVEVDRRPA